MTGLKPSLNLFGDFLEISYGLEYEPPRVQSRRLAMAVAPIPLAFAAVASGSIDGLRPDTGAVVRVES